MNLLRKIIVIALLTLSLGAAAEKTTSDSLQTNTSATTRVMPEVEMADALRKDGKIYVVITVVGVILSGLFVYLILLDRKIGKIEKGLKK